MAKVLLLAGADAHARDHRSRCPLHMAALSGSEELANALLTCGANPNKASDLGTTALHNAVRCSPNIYFFNVFTKSRRVLQSYRSSQRRPFTLTTDRRPTLTSNPNAHVFWGPIVVSQPIPPGSPEPEPSLSTVCLTRRSCLAELHVPSRYRCIVLSLFPWHSQILLKFSQALLGRVGVCRALLMARADPNATDHNSFSPLYLAAQNGHTQVVLDLLASGADASIKTTRVRYRLL